MRPRGANDPPGEPNAAQAARIRAMVDSMRKLRPARLDSIVNGADDDGSGSMALLEIAEAAVRSPKPAEALAALRLAHRRGVGAAGVAVVHRQPHGAERLDRRPDQHRHDRAAADPKDEATRDPAYIQVIGSRRLSTELGDLAEAVNRDGRYGSTFDYSYDADGHPDNFYCRSDHYMYARYGIPIAFFSTGGHRDYHQVTDEIEYLDFDKYARVTRVRGRGGRAGGEPRPPAGGGQAEAGSAGALPPVRRTAERRTGGRR